MGEADDELVDDPVFADRARQRFDFDVVGPMADEIVAVETLDLLAPRSAGHRRDMGQAGLRHHRRHRRADVLVDELRLDMGVEDGAQVFAWATRSVMEGPPSPPDPLLIQPLTSGRAHADFRAPLPAGTARRGSTP